MYGRRPIARGGVLASTADEGLNSGSRWFRWEPHIHAPGTIFNDQFNGETAWSDYHDSLERATPVIKAIAVTDYYCSDTHQRVLAEMRDNELFLHVELVFSSARYYNVLEVKV